MLGVPDNIAPYLSEIDLNTIGDMVSLPGLVVSLINCFLSDG